MSSPGLPEQSGAPAIDLDRLTKRYRHGKEPLTAVSNVTLTVPGGQVIGLLGPNGAGKTTAIKMIAGLIVPSAGSVRLNGFDISRQRRDAVRQIGAILEGSRNVYWPLSAWQNLMYFGRLKGLQTREFKARAERLLSVLGLWEWRNDTVGSFSRGMQQKVAIAAALITDPPIILLDEPTIGLDVESARTVKDWVAHLARDEGKTVVLTTHELRNAQELSDRIAVIRNGAIIADLPTHDLLANYAEDRFEVRIAGELNDLAGQLPVGVGVETDPDGVHLTLPDTSQARLQQVLGQLLDHKVPLLSVSQARPNLEEVFIRLLHEGHAAEGTASGAENDDKEKEPVA
jgi:ABC-2 type transport system ATP-binding protein